MKKIISFILALLLLLLPQPVLAAEAGEADAERICVACIDTGVSEQAIDAAAVSVGKNYVFENRDCTDRIGHGTTVAGLILSAADSENVGVVPLVCYDRYPSGVSKRADVQTISQAIRDAVDVFSCRVINLSMGVTEDAPELREAVEYAEKCGAVVVSAVGNSNASAPELTYYPAGYPTVIGVGAADGLTTAGFSQRRAVSVLAQGTDIEAPAVRNGHNTETVSGSSYACATVSGICAALLEAQPEKTPAELRALLFSAATDLGTAGFDADSGWGLVRTAQEKAQQPFLDVAPDAWYFDAVKTVYANGLMNGVGNECFSPDLSISRGMAVAVLHRMAGAPEGAYSGFADVPCDRYYARAVGWASENGIVYGVSPDAFCPNDLLTREQLLTIFHRFVARTYGDDLPGADEVQPEFSDLRQVSPYATQAVNWALQKGLVHDRDGLLAPLVPATRAEAAVLLAKIMQITASSKE